jgi:serine/threonine protein kinase
VTLEAIVPAFGPVGCSNNEGTPYLVSDFVEGLTLSDPLTARRSERREAAKLIAEVADALEHAHRQGVVHRDIKPSNIMVRPDGSPVLMDLGLAKREAGEIRMTLDGQVLGTPAYVSPEQARVEGHRIDGRSDIYSLMRWANRPPAEELLIAKAYLAMNNLAEAKRYYKAATEWLDRPRNPMRAANIATHAINPWSAIREAFKPIDDPRHNLLDWESWHECDVFRGEVERLLARYR